MKAAVVFLLLIGVVAGGAAYYATHLNDTPTTSFRTATVTRGDLLSTISATGTLEPEEVIDVGAQVAGKISSLGQDPQDPRKSIDYGSVVQQGTILARIDDAVYKSHVDEAQASLLRAKADLLQAQAKLDQTEQEWKRAETLRPTNAIAGTEYDLAVANYKAAKANVEVCKAAIAQNEAALRLAQTNLDYTIIKSPVEGKIIARRVNVGQTVVASLNAPSLFLLAKDLRRMEVWASVNEADIGSIHPDMPVHFTVDAFPHEVFKGKVAQIRLNATMTQNVVTYTVVVATDNSDLKLLPYLTANLQFEVDQRHDVLVVPNVALRWRPRTEQIAPEARDEASSDRPGRRGDRGGRAQAGSSNAPKSPLAAKPREERSRLWVKAGLLVRPIEVIVGATDGSFTEVSGEGIHEGLEVVIGEVRADQGSENTTNPFTPQLRRSKPRT